MVHRIPLAAMLVVLSISLAHADCRGTLGIGSKHLRPGRALRLWLDEKEPPQCSLVGVSDDLLVVAREGETTTVACRSIQRLDTRGRATWKGATIAGLAGGTVGAVLFAIMSKTAETEDAHSMGTAALLGAVVFGVPSATFGALIGAAVPTWKTRYRASAVGGPGSPPVPPTTPPTRSPGSAQGVSELWLSLGCASHVHGPDRHLGLVGRVAVCSPLRRSVRIGAELGFMKAGQDLHAGDGGTASEPQMLRHAGAVITVPVSSHRKRLFVSLGLGGYTSDEISDAYLGFSLGTGVQWRGKPGVALEARIHDNLLSVEEPLPAVFSVAASLVPSW